MYEENRNYNKNSKNVRENSQFDNVKSAEDVYIDKISRLTVEEIINGLLNERIITAEEYKILISWCLGEETHAEIAKRLGTSRSTISRKIKGIRKRCEAHISCNSKGSIELLHAIYAKAITTMDRPKRRDAGAARHKVAYPSEFLKKISDKGVWYKGKYQLVNKCVVPEYLEQCFGDKRTKCNLCCDHWGKSDCTRQEYYK